MWDDVNTTPDDNMTQHLAIDCCDPKSPQRTGGEARRRETSTLITAFVKSSAHDRNAIEMPS